MKPARRTGEKPTRRPDEKPITYGTTARLTEGSRDRAFRMADTGGVLLVACLVASALGASVPDAAYWCILGLFGGGAAVTGAVGAVGARAHASQYAGIGSPTAGAARPAGPFHAHAGDPANRPQSEPEEWD